MTTSSPEQQEFPVVPVPENPYTGDTAMVFADAFREQFRAMWSAGVDLVDAQELAHMYALTCAEDHLHKKAVIRRSCSPDTCEKDAH